MSRTYIHVPPGRSDAMTTIFAVIALIGMVGIVLAPGRSNAQAAKSAAAKSPWGTGDEIGTFNIMTDASRFDVLRIPVHTYLQAERGVSLLEAVWLEDLARDQVYEFLFIAAPLKLRGATASPIRPLAIAIQRK